MRGVKRTEPNICGHPERPHQSHGKCSQCYWKAHYKIHGLRRNKDREATSRTWLNQQKDKPCMDCGGYFHPCIMDFDHVRGDKFKAIGHMFTYGLSTLELEIAKCELVCSNCHRLRTYKRKHPDTEIVVNKDKTGKYWSKE